jgi:DNA-binding MltR family transcriptional regulator
MKFNIEFEIEPVSKNGYVSETQIKANLIQALQDIMKNDHQHGTDFCELWVQLDKDREIYNLYKIILKNQ